MKSFNGHQHTAKQTAAPLLLHPHVLLQEGSCTNLYARRNLIGDQGHALGSNTLPEAAVQRHPGAQRRASSCTSWLEAGPRPRLELRALRSAAIARIALS